MDKDRELKCLKLKCLKCEGTYSNMSSLRRHVKKQHTNEVEVLAPQKYRKNSNYLFSCEVCDKNFNHKRNLLFHMKRHKEPNLENEEKHSNGSKKCSMCDYNSCKQELLSHFTEHHGIPIVSEEINFPSEHEFYEWKNNIECAKNCRFVKTRGSEIFQIHKITNFVCHRSGYYKPEGKSQTHLKIKRSNKINGYCPANIRLATNNNDGSCKIRFVHTHLGHEFELGHVQLTSFERRTLAQKIASKIPFDDILDEIRDSVTDCKLKRIHLVTKKDLYNIEASFNLSSSAVRHQNDAISVESWVVEMTKEGGCVLFYKPQGILNEEQPCLKTDDFLLVIMTSAQSELLRKYGSDCVCLDRTHGMNGYNFELHTVLVLDDLREGFPCAFLISNRSDQEVLKIFFSYIKAQTGCIASKTFMSDMDESYYNAWLEIMDAPERRLFCTWHVDRAFRKNLTKIKIKEKQVETYKHVRTLLEERDPNAFRKMLEHFLTVVHNDPDTTEFGDYFQQNYSRNCEAWSYCFRKFAGLNTNMSLERMHGTIKHCYLKGKSVKRLDKGIAAIMRFVRDKLFDRLVVIHKGKISNKLNNIRIRHKKIVDMDPNLIIPSDIGWEVFSTTTHEIYQIQENTETESCTCQLICRDCEICIHRYWCSCVDSSIKFNMCKHIHLLVTNKKRNDEAHKNQEQLAEITESVEVDCNDQCLQSDENIDFEPQAILQQISKKLCCTTSMALEDTKQKLIEKFTRHVKSIHSPTELDIVKKITDQLSPTLAAVDNIRNHTFPSNSSKVPHNKKITPQRQLWSTKRNTKKRKNVLEKPSTEEATQIAASLVLQ